MRKLLLLDGSNLMFRAYYATAYSGNLMKNSKGEFTNAIFGLANMLNVILKEEFTHVLIAFDKGKQTFRHKEYEDYKAGRTKMPDEFRAQLPLIKELPKKLGMAVYEIETLEADDIIGTLAEKHYEDFDAIEIISNDKDLFQLLNDKVTLRISKRGLEPDQSFTQDTLKETMNITPSQIPDLKGLMGDSSDNLPGIPGVGEKTALKLLHEYQTIETLLQNLNDLKGKLKEKVETHGKDALKWRRLATLKLDADLPFTLDDLEYRGFDEEKLVQFYQQLEFHSLIKRLAQPLKKETKTKYTVLTSEDAIKQYCISETTFVLEAFGDNYHHAQKLGFALKNKEGHAYIDYDVAVNSPAFVDFLTDDLRIKYTFDLKQALVVLKKEGIELTGVSFDLLLAAYVLNPSNTKEDFKVVVSNFDYHDLPYNEDVYGKGAKHKLPKNLKDVHEYALKKVDAIEALRETLIQSLKESNQYALYHDIELPLTYVLAEMEFLGMRIDLEALDAFDTQLEEEIASLSEAIYEDAGETFNIASPKQLGEILFEKLELPSSKKSKTGYSTNIDVLKKLKGKHAIIEKIMRFRTISKLQSAYVKSMKESVHDDGKLHTIYKQAFTQTGRLSSIEPNLQVIPIRTEMGRYIRKVFIPEADHLLLASDYSQIELRLLAHMAKEPHLIKAYKEDQDIHSITAREIFEKDEVTASDRRIAKAVNFGIIYGQSPWGLADDLDISIKDAERFITRYYKKFSGIAGYMEGLVDYAKEHGYVETLFNRRRYIPELNSRIYQQREMGKRTAMNAPLQGSAADIIKIAMINVFKAMKEKNLKSTLVLQIHDELVFNVHPDEQDIMSTLVKETMEAATKLDVPLTVSAAMGHNLDEAK